MSIIYGKGIYIMGEPPVLASSLAVGSSVFTNVNGTKTEFIVVHQGKPSSLYDDSCNGTWLLMKDIYERRQWHSSDVNKLESSTIHSYLNSTFLNLFDSNIKDAIKQVKIPYQKNGGAGGTEQSGANGLSAKIFLLSGYEVGWTSSDDPYFPQDGAKLSYFESGTGTSANNKRIAKLNGSAAGWWLRSPYPEYHYDVWIVDSNGNYHYSLASSLEGIRPALILPSTALIDSNGNITGKTKTLSLSGTWVPSAIWKNETLLQQSIAYTASVSEVIECHAVNTNGYEYNIINMEHTSRNNWAAVDTDDGESYNVYFDEGLASSAFSVLTFAAPKTVSADFYAWFTTAFT